MAERHSNERAIFLSAIEIDAADERNAYLDSACGSDAKLRAAVEALLREHATAQSLLDSPDLIAPTLDYLPPERPGTMIGPYKLREEIGEGGMGTVFMATQTEPVRRKVALKVIKPGMDSKQVVSRFEAERQALAMMEHPNIARVFDGGATESGRPYFVMELVNGIPITDYCDRYRLTTRERLELFKDVCTAVQHAHQKGVIHRDLKPSNILVTLLDGRAIPKVIDFGIAKATSGHLTDASLMTAHAQMVGTPMYMSPEQADLSAADVDTRSDVYSLGVLLYELLTGTTPFDRERMSSVPFDEFRRIVREEDPPRPSARLSTLDAALETMAEKHHTDLRTLFREITGELDWIVMKALEKDRTRRYESANELAKDVQRYLDDEAVEACPPSTAYRLKKFARRNKVVLAFTVAVALSLILGLAGTTWQSIRATRALHGETEAKDFAKEQQHLAEKNFALAFDAVEQMLTEVASEDLADVPQAEPVRRALLEKALAFYVAFLEDRGDDPEVLQETGRAQIRVGEIKALLDEHEGAEEAYREALSIFEKLSVDEPKDGDIRYGLAEAHFGLGGVLGTVGKRVEVETSFGEALTIAKSLVEDYPGDQKYRRMLALVYASLGCVLSSQDIDEAERLQQQAEGVLEQGQVGPRDAESQAVAARVNRATGYLRATVGQLKEAEEACRHSVEVWEELSSKDPENAEYRDQLASTLHTLGWFNHRQGEDRGATENYRRAIELRHKLVADFPRVARYRSGLASTLINAGCVFEATSQEREKCHRDSLEIARQLVKEHPNIPYYAYTLRRSLHSLGNVHKDRHDFEQAETYYREALAVDEQLVRGFPDEPDHLRSIALTTMCIGLALENIPDRCDEAEAAYRESLRIFNELAERFPRVVDYRGQVADCTGFHGHFLYRMGRLEEAEATLRDCVTRYELLIAEVPENAYYRERYTDNKRELTAVRRKLLSIQVEQSPERADLRYRWGRLLAEEGKFNEALAEYSEAIRLEPGNAAFYADRARAHLEFGSVEQARTDSEQAIELDPDLAVSYSTRAMVLARRGETQEAAADWEKALSLSHNSENAASIYADRARSYAETGDFGAAVADYTEAIQSNAEDALLFAERGFAYAELGESDKARADWEDARRLDPECATCYRQRGKNRCQIGQREEALADLDKAIELAPRDHDAWRWRGKVKSELEQWEDALADFCKAAELKPTERLVYPERASVYRNLGRHDLALADYQTAIDLAPGRDVPVPFFKRADAYVRRGDIYLVDLKQPDKAVVEYSKAIELDPDNPELHQKRGDAYQAMGDSEKAEADYKEVKRLKEEKTPGEGQSVNNGSSPGWTSPERLGLRAWEDDSLNCTRRPAPQKGRTLSC